MLKMRLKGLKARHANYYSMVPPPMQGKSNMPLNLKCTARDTLCSCMVVYFA